jgi:hypothetical protein
MSNLRAAAQQALGALEQLVIGTEYEEAVATEKIITALRAALAQEEQEPVAIKDDDGLTLKAGWDDLPVGAPLYTTQPRREWQGLTDEDVGAIRWGCRWNTMSTDDSMILTTKDQVDAFARAIEQALKEKNHE